MAAGIPDGLEDCLETRLNRATNPLQVEENWEFIVSFCDMINKDIDGPQTAVRLITHKIQSPQEKESLFALTTLEACVKNCGLRFQQEIGKFRFINEVIKVISPKYLGNHMSGKVKERCVRLLYVWSESLKHEPKIGEAYNMLKKQGIVKEDPVSGDSALPAIDNHQPIPYTPPPLHPSPSVPNYKNQIFNDEQKSKLLSKLLKSKNPDDLQAANRLIKTMVKQDEERVEKVSRRTQQLETMMDNVKLLNEMLKNYQPLSSSESDVEVMKHFYSQPEQELSENIEKQRPAIFKLASDSDEKDASGAIGEILKVNDEVIQVLSTYDSLIRQSSVGKLLLLENETGDEGAAVAAASVATAAGAAGASGGGANKQGDAEKASSSFNLLDEQLLSLVASPPADSSSSSNAADLSSIFAAAALYNASTTTNNNTAPSTTTSMLPPYNNINMLDLSKQQQPFSQSTFSSTPSSQQKNHNYFCDSFNTTINTTTSSSSFSSSSSSGLDVLNQMLLKTLKDSGMKAADDASARKVSMKDISKKDVSSSHSTTTTNHNSHTATTNINHNSHAATTTTTNTSNDVASIFSIGDSFQSDQASVGGVSFTSTSTAHASNGFTGHTNLKSSNAATAQDDVAFEKLKEKSNIGASTTTPASATTATATPATATTVSTTIVSINTASTTTSTNGVKAAMVDNKNIEIKPLNDIKMSLESFIPGKKESKQIFSKDGVTCTFHFSDVRPRDDVSVIAMTTTNTSQLAIEDFTFLATVSKGAKVKVQAPNSRILAPFNPILPPPLISLLLFIANPRKEALTLKFTISYLLDDNIVTEMGVVEDLPIN